MAFSGIVRRLRVRDHDPDGRRLAKRGFGRRSRL